MKSLKTILLAAFIPTLFLLTSSKINSSKPFPSNHFEQHILSEIKNSFGKLRKIVYYPDSLRSNGYHWQSPQETASCDTGNCTDKSIYFQDVLINEKGIKTELVYGLPVKGSKIAHGWLQCKINFNTYIIECSKNGRIFSRKEISNERYIPTKNNPSVYQRRDDYNKRNGTHLNFKYYQ